MTVTEDSHISLSPSKIRHDLDLSRERMARLLDVSAKTIERWEVRDSLPSSSRVRSLLAQTQKIIDLGLSIYSVDGFHRFLQTPLSTFKGRTALQMIEHDAAKEVIAALAYDYEGLGY